MPSSRRRLTRRTAWMLAAVGVLFWIVVIGAVGNGILSVALRQTAQPTTTPGAILVQPTTTAPSKPAALAPTVAPTAPPPPTAAPEPTPAPPPVAERFVITGAGAEGVNMRAEPSTTAARVKLLKDGSPVEIAGEDRETGGRTWRNVKDPSDGATGWVAGDFVAAAPAPSAPPVASEPPSGRSPEMNLAIIQHGGSIRPDDPRIVPFAQQLDKLEAKCSEDRVKLADLTAGANKVMSDRGVTEPILNTVSGVATASEGLPAKQSCTDLFTGYAALRLNGSPGATPKPVAPAPKPAAPAPTAAPKPAVVKPSSPRAQPQGSDCPSTHPIKGNAASMIYHVPGGQSYARTQPEACFATGADAQAAGYRAAQR